MEFFEIANLLGIAVFAVSGALRAAEKKYDIFGAYVLALVTAMGGGTVTSLLLGEPVSWKDDHWPLAAATAAWLVTFFLGRSKFRFPIKSLAVVDGLGLALFAAFAAHQAVKSELAAPVVLTAGVLSAVAGGVIRDVLADEEPLCFRGDVYAAAALAGAGVVLAAMRALSLPGWVAMLIGVATTFTLRICAFQLDWQLPIFIIRRRDESGMPASHQQEQRRRRRQKP